MELGLDGKRVLITGSSRGIGLAVAREFAAEGARVCLNGREADALEAARAEVGESAVAVAGDVGSVDDAARVVAEAVSALGGLDCVVANVGSGRGAANETPGADEWERLLGINLMTAVHVCEAALDAMDGGAIVVTGSIAGITSLPAPLPYSAAKAALARYTRDLARRVAGRGVRVNMVAPGNVLAPGGTWEAKLAENRETVESYIEAEVPMKRFATPEEVAAAVVFLASERSSFTTGACLVVDGGQSRD